MEWILIDWLMWLDFRTSRGSTWWRDWHLSLTTFLWPWRSRVECDQPFVTKDKSLLFVKNRVSYISVGNEILLPLDSLIFCIFFVLFFSFLILLLAGKIVKMQERKTCKRSYMVFLPKRLVAVTLECFVSTLARWYHQGAGLFVCS